MPRGKSKRKAHVKEGGEPRLSERNVRLRADWRFATQPIVTPFTAGSSYAFLVADFGDPHYKQEDTSLNKALWDVWPVDAPDGYEKALKQAKAKRDVLFVLDNLKSVTDEGSIDAAALQAALPYSEHARIACNLRLLQELHSCLYLAGWLNYDTLADGMSPMHLLNTRRAMFDVTPLNEAVKTAKGLLEEGNRLITKASVLADEDEGDEKEEEEEDGEEEEEKGQEEEGPHSTHKYLIRQLAGAGVSKLCSALLSLWPWTASGLIMTPEVAFGSGIAQIEGEIWGTIGNACIYLVDREERCEPALVVGDQSEDLDAYFLVLGRLANLVPVHTRYVSYDNLHRSSFNVSGFGQIFEPVSQIYKHELNAGILVSYRCSTGAGTYPDAWAHATCNTSHRGCLGLGFTKSQMDAAADNVAKAKKERDEYFETLAEESRRELFSGGSDNDREKEKEEEVSINKAGNKERGPKPMYTVREIEYVTGETARTMDGYTVGEPEYTV